MAEFSGEQVRKFFESLIPARMRRSTPVVPVVRLTGVIGFSSPLRPGVTLAGVARLLDRAFSMRRAKAVALLINSPGGSPVQSHLIYRRIRQLADEKKIPVIVFIEDAGASGGYMVACAGDEIYCDPFSIVGSIGVIGATFGLDKAIAKLGIERRVYTSGDRKMTLDPFLPEKPEDVARLKGILEQIHEAFIAHVKSRRGAKLAEDPDLFTGEFWLGGRATELGLADGIGHLIPKMKEIYGEKVRFARYGRRRTLFQRFGATLAQDAITAIEERAGYARFGL